MTTIKTGDEVRIITRNHTTPEGGHVGHVVKVGRKYATAEYTVTRTQFGREETYDRTIEFDLADGGERGSGTNHGSYVRTPEQIVLGQHLTAAMSALNESGLDIRMGYQRFFTLECMEALAEVVKAHRDAAEG